MTSQSYMVLSCLGPDRVGLVAQVTRFLVEHGANVEDSRMAILGAEFGMMILVSGAPEKLAAVARDAEKLEKDTGLTVLTRQTRSPAEHRRSATLPCVVGAEALDHEGIVHAVSDTLRAQGVSIVSLETSAYAAPVTGSPLFRMEARVDVPRGLTLSQLRATLEELGRRENIDVFVRSLTGSAG